MWSDMLHLVPTLLPNPGYQLFGYCLMSNTHMKRLEILKVTLLPELKSGPCIFCGLKWVHYHDFFRLSVS